VKGLVDLFKTVRKSKEEPARFLEQWLQERSTPASG
jgi:hypothetical protein